MESVVNMKKNPPVLAAILRYNPDLIRVSRPRRTKTAALDSATRDFIKLVDAAERASRSSSLQFDARTGNSTSTCPRATRG